MTVASYGMVLCGNSDDVHHRYRGKIEKVKFGVPINEAFVHDIPATLLVLLLKVNKEGPAKKDIWRAPGNQAQVRKLSHIMQHGRLVNIANFSVYTAASVIKKFLSKLPGGIFGRENEEILFNSALNGAEVEKQRQVFYRIFCSLPVPSQHLLVLLFGTFRIVADSSDGNVTSMNPNAIAISVAPSLFHSCIHEGRQARVEDLQRFKLASNIVCSIITSFGDTNLFPRECYEFYARITGRTLRIDENWTFSFQYPSIAGCFSHGESSAANDDVERPTSSRIQTLVVAAKTPPHSGRLHNRLSSSVGEVLLEASDVEECELDAMRPLTACGGDASKSLSYLQWVHENQTRRMRSRSEWFLSPVMQPKISSKSVDYFAHITGKQMLHTIDLRIPQKTKDKRVEMRSEEENCPTKTQPSNPRPPLQDRGSQCVNIAGWSLPDHKLTSTVAAAAAPAPNSASMTRRRSWKVQQLRPHLSQGKASHSLDNPDKNDSGGQLQGYASSVEANTWLTEVVANEEIPKKRRSLKKKTSTQF